MSDPFELFRRTWERAHRAPVADPTAVALATADAGGRPSVRMVLLKSWDPRGFVFFTNLESRKAEQLAANPRAALCCYWPAIDEQVRIEGPVERLEDSAADAYFASRPRGSRIGAWASLQSRPLETRFALLRRYAATRLRFAGREIPRPPFWGGFRLRPERIEFWVNKAHRLHDRRLFTRDAGGWSDERLYP